MRNVGRMVGVAMLAVAACGDTDTDGSATETMADTADAMVEGGAGMDDMAEVSAAGLLDPNAASADDLRAAGLTDAAVAAITGGRPFDDMLAVDAALAGVLDEPGREEAYRVLWIPIDLNEASREEILLIPGVGDRMASEFEEYRPYRAMAEFHREIGKYVDDQEVERLARYVTLE